MNFFEFFNNFIFTDLYFRVCTLLWIAFALLGFIAFVIRKIVWRIECRKFNEKMLFGKKKQDNGVIRQFKSIELGFAPSYAKTALLTMHYLKMGTPVDHNSSYLIEEATKRQKNGAVIITNFPRDVEDAE